MARSLFRDTICLRGPAGLIPVSGAEVRFYEPGTLTPIAFSLYPDGQTTTTLPSPYVTGSLGELEVWADQPHRVRIIVGMPGYAVADETIDIEADPAAGATDQDIAGAILAHEAKADPHQQYLLESEANLLYLPIDTPIPDLSNYWTKSESDARYLPIGTVIPPPPDLSVYYTKVESDARYQPVGSYLTTAVAAATYQSLTQKGQPNGYASLDASGLLPASVLPPIALTETYVATSDAEMAALAAQRGDVCIRPDISKTYILATDPASVLGNWKEVLTSGGTATNVTVIESEEFAPAAAATTVTLGKLPTDVLEVSRNGVAQSAAAGNYTVAGQVVTFTDAFVAGERVAVIYSVGTSSPVSGTSYTKSESDTRYVSKVNPGEEMAGSLVVNDGGFGWYRVSLNTSPGSIQIASLSENYDRLHINATTQEIYFGPGTTPTDAMIGRWGAGEVYTDQKLRVGGTLRVTNKFVAASPDAGNTVEWRSNGFFVPAGSVDLSGYYTKTESDARYQPVGSYLTQAAGDARYSLSAHNHTGVYLPVGGGTLSGALTVSAGGIAVTGASTFSVAPTVGGSALLTQSAGDARYTQGGITQAAADLRYEPLDTMYTKAESDAKYALTGHTHSGVYATPTDVSTAVSNHAAAADPHTTYLNQTRGDARYSLTGHNHDATYLALAGGTVTGATTFNTRPTVAGVAQPRISVQSSAPSSPATGDLWVW